MKAFKTIYIIAIFVITGIIISVFAGKRFLGLFGGLKGTGSYVTDSVSVGEFKDIDVDMDYADITIKNGNDYHVEYTVPSNNIPVIKVDGDCLKIRSNVKGFSMNWDFKNTPDYNLTIFVPEGVTEFGKFKLVSDAGDIDLDGYSFDKVDFDCDAGDIRLDKIIAKTLTIEADAGNIQASDSTLGDTTINSNAGNIELKDSTAGVLKMETNMGEINVNGGSFAEGTMETNMGQIKINATFDDLKADCDMGEITVKNDLIENASCDLNTEMGTVSVNGDNKGTHYKKSANAADTSEKVTSEKETAKEEASEEVTSEKETVKEEASEKEASEQGGKTRQ